MIDLKERFKRLDRIPSPDLWAAIQARAAQPVEREDVGRIRRRVGLRRLIPAAAAVTVVVAVLTLVLPLTRVERRPAFAIVEDAIKAVQSLPPFSASVSYSFVEAGDVSGRGTYAVSYRSRTVWRVEVTERVGNPAGPGNFAEELAFMFGEFSGPSDYIVSDGERVGLFLAAKNYFFSKPLELSGSPLGQLAWEDPFAGPERGVFPTPVPAEGREGPPLTTWRKRCDDSKTFANEQVAGRPARHVECGDWELWIDATTGLILKVRTSAYRAEIRTIEYSARFASEVFEVELPEGACDRGTGGASPDDPQTCLKIGQAAPTWSGSLLGGGSFDLAKARGRPTLVLFWSDFFQPGDLPFEALKDFQVGSDRWASRATLVSVDTGPGVTKASASEFIDRWGYTFPVVLDGVDPESPGGVAEIATSWGIEGVPAWVALDAEGRVIDVRFGRLTADQIDDLLSRAGG